MYSESLKLWNDDVNPLTFESGAKYALAEIEGYLENAAIQPETFQERLNIATTASASDDFGRLIVEIYDANDENLTLRYHQGPLGHEVTGGMRSPATLGTKSKVDAKLETATMGKGGVIIYNRILTTSTDMAKIIKFTGNKPYLIVARDYIGQAVQTFSQNTEHNLVIIKHNPDAGGSEDLLYDMGAFTGSRVLESLDELNIESCGQVTSVTSTPHGTIISSENDYSEYVKSLADKVKTLAGTAREIAEARIKNIKFKVVDVFIPAPNPSEFQRDADRLDDAWFALTNGVKYGYVIGGGLALLNAQRDLKLPELNGDANLGAQAVLQSLSACSENLLLGTRYKIKQIGGVKGYNQITDKVEDFLKLGIIDALPAIKIALKAGVSGAMNLLSLGGMLKLGK